ncbi:MAG TPA: ABC transporter permease [bacterium]|nr:ABC transporter permease [bacterium]HPT30096.1 ABC transporter permease [bacterium]
MFATLRPALKISIKALLANKSRSFLTMLGIIIGVAAVILIMSLGAGAQGLILDQIKGLGSDLVGILPGKSENDGPPASVMGVVITTLTYDDLKAIRQAPYVKAASGYTKGVDTVACRDNSYDTNLTGTTADYLDVEGGEVSIGRFFSSDEEQNLTKVIVLGSVVKQELFGDSDAVGQRVKVKNQVFEVIGVMANRGKVAFQDYDDQVFLPLKTMQKLISGVDYLGYIRVKIDGADQVTPAISEIEAILRQRHEIDDPTGQGDDFSVRAMAQALDMITTVTDALRFFLIAMAAISLIVGGIGIMNIMLISVNERTREIGLRKAVGATRRNIITQFLLEAIALTLIGGLIGVFFGTLFSYLAALIINSLGYDFSFIISPGAIILALSVSSLVGLVFGLYPAIKASKLEPVEALSYE